MISARVLWLDEDLVNSRRLLPILEREGYGIELAPLGREAQRRLMVRDHDLVILGISAREDHWQFCSRLLALDDAPLFPLLATGDDRDRTRGLDLGADDCARGLHMLMRSDYCEPINPGQDRMVTVDRLADIIAAVAKIAIAKKHVPGPQGVRGRNADVTRIRTVLGREPEVSLEQGLAPTYATISNRQPPLASGCDVLDSIKLIDECYETASQFDMPWYGFRR